MYKVIKINNMYVLFKVSILNVKGWVIFIKFYYVV